jgi:hypothetical protein
MRDLFIVHPETIWVLIPLVAIIGSFFIRWQRIRAETAVRGTASDAVAQELRDSIQRLEMRVANLERAVTTAETERRFAL